MYIPLLAYASMQARDLSPVTRHEESGIVGATTTFDMELTWRTSIRCLPT